MDCLTPAIRFRADLDPWFSRISAGRNAWLEAETLNYKSILIKNDGVIRTITLNRPERRNAMTQAMQTELISAFEESASGDFRVLIITGAGDSFCSGLDLSEL